MKETFFGECVIASGVPFTKLIDAKIQTLQGICCGLSVQNQNVLGERA